MAEGGYDPARMSDQEATVSTPLANFNSLRRILPPDLPRGRETLEEQPPPRKVVRVEPLFPQGPGRGYIGLLMGLLREHGGWDMDGQPVGSCRDSPSIDPQDALREARAQPHVRLILPIPVQPQILPNPQLQLSHDQRLHLHNRNQPHIQPRASFPPSRSLLFQFHYL